jgi:outer membrane protein assembly factor BamB
MVALTLAALVGLIQASANGAAAGAVPGTSASTRTSAGRGPVPARWPLRATGRRASRALSGSGAQLWVRRYNGPGNGMSNDDVAHSVAVSPSGGVVFVTGYSTADTQDYVTIAYNAATGARLWASRYNGPANNDDQANSVAVSPDGGIVFVTGYSTGATSGADYATVAYNAATGARLWVRRYNGPANGTDAADSVAVSPDGGTVVVTGSSDGGTSTYYDYATVAYNAATGARLWVRRYSGPAGYGEDAANSVAVSPDSSTVYVTGSSDGGAPTGWDYATVAYTAATGAQLWVQRYDGGTAQHGGVAISVAASPDGNAVFVTGFSDGAGTGSDYVTIAYNAATGATLWASRYNSGGVSTDEPHSLAVSPDGSTVFVTGYSTGATSGDDYLTVAYNAATGATLWARRYSGPGNGTDHAVAVAVSPAGDIVYATGYSTGQASGEDFGTVAYNAVTGATLWARRYNGPANSTDGAYALAVATTGTVFATGISYGATSGADCLTIAYSGGQ